jgi:hypothetical protein
MVLTGSFALSSVTGLCCHRRRHNCQSNHRQLDISVGISGPHNFAVRFLRSSSKSAKASTASRPTFVTMANAPLLRRDARSCKIDLPDGLSEIFLQTGLDRHFADLPDGQISRRETVHEMDIFRPHAPVRSGQAV